jgi:hypothetical protein
MLTLTGFLLRLKVCEMKKKIILFLFSKKKKIQLATLQGQSQANGRELAINRVLDGSTYPG